MKIADSLNEKLSFVVVGCDKYSDLWPSFFDNLFKHFPIVNDYNVYLISNYLQIKDQRVVNINVGKDISWSSNFLLALDKIREEAVFLLIDDLYIKNPVDKNELVNLIELFFKYEMNYLRLTGKPKPTGDYLSEGVWEVKSNELYRTATVFSIWKKSILLQLLSVSETAWDFEYYGSERARSYSGWYSTKRNIIPYYNLVIKGEINPIVLKQLELNGFKIVTSRRLMNHSTVFSFYFQIIRSFLFSIFIPTFIKLRVRIFIKKYLNR